MPESVQPSDAILTVPNLLTFFRLALTPVFVVVALVMDNMGAAVALALLGLVTDLVDGRIARRFGQVSKLGIQLDPLSDRLGVAAGALVLIVKHLAPVWAVLIVIGRDALLVLVGAPVLKARGVPIPPVTRVGKYGSFATSVAFGLFLASGIHSTVHPARVLAGLGWFFFVVGAPLYLAAGVGYVTAGLRTLKSAPGSRSDG
jgi:cardiolipin synthase